MRVFDKHTRGWNGGINKHRRSTRPGLSSLLNWQWHFLHTAHDSQCISIGRQYIKNQNLIVIEWFIAFEILDKYSWIEIIYGNTEINSGIRILMVYFIVVLITSVQKFRCIHYLKQNVSECRQFQCNYTVVDYQTCNAIG